jgi:hypothetical protein
MATQLIRQGNGRPTQIGESPNYPTINIAHRQKLLRPDMAADKASNRISKMLIEALWYNYHNNI